VNKFIKVVKTKCVAVCTVVVVLASYLAFTMQNIELLKILCAYCRGVICGIASNAVVSGVERFEWRQPADYKARIKIETEEK